MNATDWHRLADVLSGRTVIQDGWSYEYLQIVRSVRDGARVRQELVASLGRRDLLVATGQLDRLVQALARFSTRLRVVEAAMDERLVARQARSWGPALVFGRLWERQGLPEILNRLAASRRFGFDPERVAFALALQRLCAPGSDLQGAACAQTVEAPGFPELALHHFYRTLPWLAAIRQRTKRLLNPPQQPGVARGSWFDVPEDLRSAYRIGNYSVDRGNFMGFRVARTLSRSES